eukprot:m.152442 g.152442  ORF g.152442 m.152442 type:complete len:363 (-) comp9776_c0_seq5:938-2026(-)
MAFFSGVAILALVERSFLPTTISSASAAGMVGGAGLALRATPALISSCRGAVILGLVSRRATPSTICLRTGVAIFFIRGLRACLPVAMAARTGVAILRIVARSLAPAAISARTGVLSAFFSTALRAGRAWMASATASGSFGFARSATPDLIASRMGVARAFFAAVLACSKRDGVTAADRGVRAVAAASLMLTGVCRRRFIVEGAVDLTDIGVGAVEVAVCAGEAGLAALTGVTATGAGTNGLSSIRAMLWSAAGVPCAGVVASAATGVGTPDLIELRRFLPVETAVAAGAAMGVASALATGVASALAAGTAAAGVVGPFDVTVCGVAAGVVAFGVTAGVVAFTVDAGAEAALAGLGVPAGAV